MTEFNKYVEVRWHDGDAPWLTATPNATTLIMDGTLEVYCDESLATYAPGAWSVVKYTYMDDLDSEDEEGY